MTERFFITNQIEEDQRDILVSDVLQIHQIARVLRKKQGDIIFILDNSSYEYKCEIKQLTKKLLLLKILDRSINKNEPTLKVAIYQSLIKKNKMEFVFEKCTEIGVSEFHPILSENSVKLSLNLDRANIILKEATEQSQRGMIPTLSDIKKFKSIAKQLSEDSLNIIFHEKEKGENLINFLIDNKEKIENNKEINLFIGPEGGFSEDEIIFAESLGFKVLSLGKRVLRAETAAIVATSLVLSFDK